MALEAPIDSGAARLVPGLANLYTTFTCVDGHGYMIPWLSLKRSAAVVGLFAVLGPAICLCMANARGGLVSLVVALLMTLALLPLAAGSLWSAVCGFALAAICAIASLRLGKRWLYLVVATIGGAASMSLGGISTTSDTERSITLIAAFAGLVCGVVSLPIIRPRTIDPVLPP
ncbi:hypothetical protein [Caulobacter soli]|uniref:hypothetical protein n=1 Tax=Caulobacter soli TaxID=2708539 RepID=UPI0013ED7BE8|nr:hypothetical protein [Caulobacter soli]